MASIKLLTIFGATGNQGGSVIDAVLAHGELSKNYKLRGITRSTSSASAKALIEKGVEMVAANVNDVESLKAAVRGSYGVFGVTNFWDKDVMNKKIEMQQGMNIFHACKDEGVSHYVFSSLPHVAKLTKGVLSHVDHFDGKAEVREFVEVNKGDMIASYFEPAMYMVSYKGQIRVVDGEPTMMMPFDPENMNTANWPLIDPRADTGKYVMGLFEGQSRANGVAVHAVSAWVSPKQLLQAISQSAKREIGYRAVDVEKLPSEMSWPDMIASELTETMLLVGNYQYYGKGAEHSQEKSDMWLLPGTKTISLQQAVENDGPWSFGA